MTGIGRNKTPRINRGQSPKKRNKPGSTDGLVRPTTYWLTQEQGTPAGCSTHTSLQVWTEAGKSGDGRGSRQKVPIREKQCLSA